MIRLTPVTDSKARMFRPSRPMIRPFISSLGRCRTLTTLSAVCSLATRWIASTTICRARSSAVGASVVLDVADEQRGLAFGLCLDRLDEFVASRVGGQPGDAFELPAPRLLAQEHGRLPLEERGLTFAELDLGLAHAPIALRHAFGLFGLKPLALVESDLTPLGVSGLLLDRRLQQLDLPLAGPAADHAGLFGIGLRLQMSALQDALDLGVRRTDDSLSLGPGRGRFRLRGHGLGAGRARRRSRLLDRERRVVGGATERGEGLFLMIFGRQIGGLFAGGDRARRRARAEPPREAREPDERGDGEKDENCDDNHKGRYDRAHEPTSFAARVMPRTPPQLGEGGDVHRRVDR